LSLLCFDAVEHYYLRVSDIGISFLIVEHRLDIVLEYADQVYVMAGGRIVAEGRSKEILENPEVIEVYLGAQSWELLCRL
jgi:branched-chain amino acid transport system ATP-binding protein